MSTTNSNLDNDPFPVFTPRSSLNTILQGRSPAPQQQSQSGVNLIQQSPYQQNNPSNRFTSNNNNNNLINIRSPNSTNSPSLRNDQRLIHSNIPNSPNFVLPNMVQNLKIQTPPTTSLTTNTTPTPSSAHRKLFQMDMSMVMNEKIIDNNSPQLQHDYADSINGRIGQQADLSNIYNLKRSDSYFMSDEIRSEILRKNQLIQSTANPDIVGLIPQQIKDYHNLVPLDNQQSNIEHKSRVFNYQTISYKATHVKKNCVYFLKIILGFRLSNQRCMELVELWKKVQHANITGLRDIFGTKEFNGDHATVFVYDYYPGLETLQQRLYNNQNFNLKGWANPYNLDGSARPYSAGKGKIGFNNSRSLGLLPEQIIWDYIIQLTSIIRTIHASNLSCRILTASRILIDSKSRLRLSGAGIFDVIDYENNVKNIANFQQEDLYDLGRLVLAVACNSLFAIQQEHLNTSIDIITKNYSPDLKSFIIHFLTAPVMHNNRLKSINDAMPMVGARFYTSLDSAYTRGDIIESDLSKEVENSRLFRLICKLNVVLDRQDCIDVAWSETGDRYMLKLFRDYVFHQSNSNGAPWIDLSHIVQCLNKLDYGSNDKICLQSPDGQNVMIVTYAHLKKTFEKAFAELTSSVI